MHIVCLGEVLVDMFPAEVGRRLVEVSAFRPKPGGAPANVAVAAARLGARSAFVGKVGDEAFGHHLADVLRQEGVEVRGMRYDQEARTGMAFIALPDENTAEFVFYRNPGADMRLVPSIGIRPGAVNRYTANNARTKWHRHCAVPVPKVRHRYCTAPGGCRMVLGNPRGPSNYNRPRLEINIEF